MHKIIRFTLVLTFVLSSSACNLPWTNPQPVGTSVLKLDVQVQNANETFNTVGQVIRYNYVITNTGTSRLAGPIILTDPNRQIQCPDVNTVFNQDAYLDFNESITCTGTYSITQADLAGGSVKNDAIANVGGLNSNRVSITVQFNVPPTSVLTLTKTANPTTYSQIGQTITFTYVITNMGTVELTGPFSVTDNKATVTCTQPADGKLSSGEPMNCTATYIITQADMSAVSLTNSATASGGGAPASAPATATVTNLTITPTPTMTPTSSTPGSPPNLPPPGSTVQHRVIKGEWLIQIARCYGARFEDVRDANPQITDPHFILPEMTVSVPRIGSVGKIYGPPCIERYIVKSGDTWESIAQKYNADVEVLQVRNGGTLSVGRELIVPKNSAGGASPPPTSQPSQPIRLTIPPGGTSVSHSGTLPPSGLARHVINASQGQVMSVTVNAPANQVILVIYNPAGAAIKPADTTLTWNGVVPQTGDYGIDLGSNISTSNVLYTLEVSLTSVPATFTPTATATSTTPGTTGTFQQAADINRGANPSRPAFLTEYNGMLYFQADGGDGMGNELWRYDGTNATRVADINNGASGSNPAYLTVYNGALYFGALGSDGAGIELWRYDGTSATRAADIWSGPDGSNPSSLAVFNGVLYFSANGNDGAGIELWKYDGTSASRAANIFNGPGNSSPSSLVVFNNALHFQADGGDGMGHELWKFDGTTATRVADIWNGSGNANPSSLAVYNNILYFGANGSDGAGYELWKYDGSSVSRVADIWAGTSDSTPAYLTVYNGLLHFSANDGSGQELWRFDGTTASRVPEPSGTNISSPSFLAPYKGALYFQADGNNGSGLELWRYSASTG